MLIFSTRVFLFAALAAPFCYFGIQLLAAPFYPNYDFIRLAASNLGSPQSTVPAVFNVGAILGGLITIVGAYGFWCGFVNTSTPRAIVWLLCLVVVLTGCSSLWAGLYPLPDPRHAQNPFALFGLLPMPFLIAIAFWHLSSARAYLLLPVLVLLGVMPIFAGLITVDRTAYDGLLQRILGLATYSPIAIGAWLSLQKTNSSSPKAKS
jgi:hypothetical membrane protein